LTAVKVNLVEGIFQRLADHTVEIHGVFDEVAFVGIRAATEVSDSGLAGFERDLDRDTGPCPFVSRLEPAEDFIFDFRISLRVDIGCVTADRTIVLFRFDCGGVFHGVRIKRPALFVVVVAGTVSGGDFLTSVRAIKFLILEVDIGADNPVAVAVPELTEIPARIRFDRFERDRLAVERDEVKRVASRESRSSGAESCRELIRCVDLPEVVTILLPDRARSPMRIASVEEVAF